ncbi:3-hydroxyisobutyryl-CoA hydrolase, mitochondrial [Wickerhamomyces ciferrii]|uniref:3-hydroxyisobutyryl-CoA hydrolase n=1 Tax=Wickerhamomyces ciferrii (strain ATCC 14091 / BCRC 22168 / CBS 111 / JCM 3599 / NBRC 0793 / NRRL Y-1031 F-60-10) TaxID=1206466 RepID=K0KH74_WICCF|nr:3-hydroxyisobutyryl-CoA hydrolase, mitochondrial [Wickerhamomyces ciferrii]CCH42341.1 3-hydroxyisobutyryl-CoA hydrolase, mitochondrial [Wickerhamomyces ciferrii]
MLRSKLSHSIRAQQLFRLQTMSSNYSTKVNTHSVDAKLENDVLFQNVNNTKIITLNRPTKLNSLNASMVSKIYPRLQEYSKSFSTQLIIQNSNGRAFCAGGDVTSCVEANKKGQFEQSIEFFQKEYSMNYLLATYNKPIVSILDGITMGGGVGLSIHTPFRIITEKTRWAMPEMDIGFSPDVGTSFALNKLVPSSLGWYLALTGENLFSWDVYFSGLGTHYVSSNKIHELQDRLTNLVLPSNVEDQYEIINSVLEEFVEPLPTNYKFKYSIEELQLLEKVFTRDTNMERIFENLKKSKLEFAKTTLETLKKKSPLSLKVGLEILQRGSNSDIHAALTNELNAAVQFMKDSDFNTGVSSKLIEKSKNIPNWKYKSIEKIPAKEVVPFFKKGQSSPLDENFNITFNQYPKNFGLPKSQDLISVAQGLEEQSKESLIKSFLNDDKFNNKVGLKQYLDLFYDVQNESKSKL